MSATDELRRLLDKRGVEWLNSDGDCYDSDDDYMLAEQDSRKTTWSVDIAGDDMTITAHEVYENDELEEWFDLEFHEYFTLEQVIATTLGSGTLTAEQVEEAVYRNCKFYEGGEVDVESITDELNAALGEPNETAKVLIYDMLDFIGNCCETTLDCDCCDPVDCKYLSGDGELAECTRYQDFLSRAKAIL